MTPHCVQLVGGGGGNSGNWRRKCPPPVYSSKNSEVQFSHSSRPPAVTTARSNLARRPDVRNSNIFRFFSSAIAAAVQIKIYSKNKTNIKKSTMRRWHEYTRARTNENKTISFELLLEIEKRMHTSMEQSRAGFAGNSPQQHRIRIATAENMCILT